VIHRASAVRAIGQDVVLVAMPVVAALASGGHGWLWLLSAAGLAVLAVNVITLHFPREVEVDAAGVRFRGYGREHAYAWSDVRVRLRRFVVRDRVYVRIEDVRSGRRRGYWLVASLSRYEALVAALAERAVGAPAEVKSSEPRRLSPAE
jgi:hypothetical protein